MLNSFSLLQSDGVANEEYKSSLERDNAELRSTVARQSQRVGQLEKTSPPEEDDTARLQEIIRLQHEKIQYYQQEIEHSKQDMVRLEGLLQKVQEENMRRELYHHTPLVGSKYYMHTFIWLRVAHVIYSREPFTTPVYSETFKGVLLLKDVNYNEDTFIH